MNSSGLVIASGGQNEEFVRLEPSDSQSIRCGWFRIPQKMLGSDLTKTTFKLFVSMFTREFAQNPPSRVPNPTDGPAKSTVSKKFEGLQENLSITTWSTIDSDNQVTVSWGLLVHNETSRPIPMLTLKAELLDEENAVLEQTDSSATLHPGGVEWMENSFSGIRRGQAKQAQLRFSLAMYSLLASVAIETAKTRISND
jgi:hypothetical protein